MLVLHRNIDESVTLITPEGHEVKVTVSSFYKQGVRLIFEADPEVMIIRSELANKQPPIIRKILSHLLPALANHGERSGT